MNRQKKISTFLGFFFLPLRIFFLLKLNSINEKLLFYLQTFAFVVSPECFNVVTFFFVSPRVHVFLEFAAPQWNYEFVILFIHNTQKFSLPLLFSFRIFWQFFRISQPPNECRQLKWEFRARQNSKFFRYYTRVQHQFWHHRDIFLNMERNLKHNNTLVTKYPYYLVFFLLLAIFVDVKVW